MKKELVNRVGSIILVLFLSCGKLEKVYNSDDYVKKIDKEFFTKGEIISPENKMELYVIKKENGKLVKKNIVNREKEDKELKNRYSTLLNYDNNNLYLLFYKDIDVGNESRKVKIFYYDKNYNLKPFNEKEYILDNIDKEKNQYVEEKNRVENVENIEYIINEDVYLNYTFQGGFKNNERIVKNENGNIHSYNKKKNEVYLMSEDDKILYIYNTKSNMLREEKLDDTRKYFFFNRIEVDNENIVYSRKNLLVQRSIKTGKEKILYKACNRIDKIISLNKKNTLITFGVSGNNDIFSMISGYVNKCKWNHDVVYDLETSKIYILETWNDELIKNKEQLKLTKEIINHGIEKIEEINRKY